MASDSIELDKLLIDKMTWLNERQRVLAQNVANVDTPGYAPRDLAPFKFKDTLQQAMLAPAATRGNHIATSRPAKPGIAVIKTKSDEVLPSGNSINLEEEMLKVSTTGMDYQQTAGLLKRWHLMFKTALGK